MNEKLKLLIDAFDCEIVEVNHYCENCGKSCEEVIPTFNCTEQMKTSNIEKILEEFRNANNIQNNAIALVLDELKRDNQVDTSNMPENSPTKVITDYQNLSLEDKKRVYNTLFGLGSFGDKIDPKLMLVSFVVSTLCVMKKQDETKTMRDAINLLTEGSQFASEKFKETLEVVCEDFAFGVHIGNTFGLKTLKEVKEKVHEILGQNLPF
jgi:hypothetical protein